MTRLVTNNQLQCCRLSLRWTWNELTSVWKSPNTSKREKISVTAEEAEETKKKIQKNTKKTHQDSWTVYCSWEAMLLRVTADHSDTDPLFSVVPGINQTFRVGVWEARNMGGSGRIQPWHGSKNDGWTTGLRLPSKLQFLWAVPGVRIRRWVRLPRLNPCPLRKGAQELDHRAMEGDGPSSHVSGPEGFAANLLVCEKPQLSYVAKRRASLMQHSRWLFAMLSDRCWSSINCRQSYCIETATVPLIQVAFSFLLLGDD